MKGLMFIFIFFCVTLNTVAPGKPKPTLSPEERSEQAKTNLVLVRMNRLRKMGLNESVHDNVVQHMIVVYKAMKKKNFTLADMEQMQPTEFEATSAWDEYNFPLKTIRSFKKLEAKGVDMSTLKAFATHVKEVFKFFREHGLVMLDAQDETAFGTKYNLQMDLEDLKYLKLNDEKYEQAKRMTKRIYKFLEAKGYDMRELARVSSEELEGTQPYKELKDEVAVKMLKILEKLGFPDKYLEKIVKLIIYIQNHVREQDYKDYMEKWE